MNTTDLEARLLASIKQRYQNHAAKDLTDYIFANYLFHPVEPAIIDFACALKNDIAAYLDHPSHLHRLIEYCVRSTKQYTYQRNQFINFTRFYDELLYAEYERFFNRIKQLLITRNTHAAIANSFSVATQEHHQNLHLILASYCIFYQDDDLEKNPLLRTTPCEEYSIPFQLRLLKTNPADLKEPILDIGCGASGELVHYFREKGYMAFGLDRLAPTADYFFQQDWLNFYFSRQAWGTITAHQSFSTHFIYHHLHNPNEANIYAGLYMSILASLKPDGSFFYAPGLPFFEKILAKTNNYEINRTPIATNNNLGIDEILYSVKVSKIASKITV